MKIAHIHVWDQNNKGDLGIVMAVQDLLNIHLPGAELVDVPMDVLKQADEEWLSQINECDLVVIGGGGIYYRYFLPFNQKYIARIKPPIVIIGVGYINEFGGQPLSQEDLDSIVYLNNQAKLTSVRDLNTFNLLRSNGYEGQLYLIGDPVVVLEEKQVNYDFGETAVGFNLNYSGWLGFKEYEDQILTSYRTCIDGVISKYGAKVFYFSHHPGEQNILAKLDRDLEVVDWEPKQQKWAYGKINLLLGMMLHAGIKAFGAGTPTVMLAYDVKNAAFANFIGHPELIVMPEDLVSDHLWSKVDGVMENENYYRDEFNKEKLKISEKIDGFMQKISTIN